MATVLKLIKSGLAAVVALAILWAFYDVSQRYIAHRRSLATRPIELTVLHWGNPGEDKIVDDLVQRYQAEHADTRIVRINAGGDFRNKLKTMMAADIAPDVFYLPPDLLPELAENNLIAPLDDRFKKEPAALRDDYWPILLDAFRYETGSGMLGRGPLYALPKDFTTAVFYANTDLFDQAGIDWRAIQKNGWGWPEFEADMKKIRGLAHRGAMAERDIYGTLLQLWPDTFRNMLWTYGGDFFERKPDGTPDYTRTAFGSAGSRAAVDLIRRLRLTDKTAYNSTGIAKDGGKEFLIGNIGCTGPIGCWMMPTYKGITDFKWDMLPIPAGTEKASQVFYTGWTMSSRTKHPDQAYELVRFLCGRDGQVMQGRAGLAIPALRSVAKSDDFLNPPDMPKIDRQLFLDAVASSRLPQLPKQTEFGTIVQDDADLAITAGRLTGPEMADRIQADWSHELGAPLRAREWPAMPWRPILIGTALIGAGALAALFFKVKREKLGAIDRRTERAGFTFIAPWIIGFIVLTLGPMVVSLLLAFSQWTGMTPMANAKFVGAANFKQLITYDPLFAQSLKVTAYFVIVGVPVSQLAALLIAMLMNQKVRGIAFFRTVYFVPSVVSGAALAVLWLQLFNNDYGLINQVLRPFAHLLHMNAPNWFGYDQSLDPPTLDAARWAVPAFVLMGLWGVGGGMIVYLAGLKGINASLYEAARIDGAGRLRQAWNVTIPMLSPLIFYNLVMGVIGSFQVFTQAYIMTNGGPENTTLFYVLNLYRQAFEFHNIGYASAMAWVLFLLVLVLTLAVFKGSKKLVYYEGLR